MMCLLFPPAGPGTEARCDTVDDAISTPRKHGPGPENVPRQLPSAGMVLFEQKAIVRVSASNTFADFLKAQMRTAASLEMRMCKKIPIRTYLSKKICSDFPAKVR
jgi:hypothetical protein